MPLRAAHAADFACDKAFRRFSFCWVPAKGAQMLVKSFKHLQDIFHLQSTVYMLTNTHNPSWATEPIPLLLTGERQSDQRERKVTEQVTDSDRLDLHRLFIRS